MRVRVGYRRERQLQIAATIVGSDARPEMQRDGFVLREASRDSGGLSFAGPGAKPERQEGRRLLECAPLARGLLPGPRRGG